FRKSLELAKGQGHFTGQRKLKAALDTTHILGRGAVKDTSNLLADGIVLVLRVLAKQAGEQLAVGAEREGWGRDVTAGSVKGQAAIDWSDAGARERLLQAIVADADRLLERVRTARGLLEAGNPDDGALAEAAGLLARVLAQDIERTEAGPTLHQGVAEDRMPAVHDPEVRHGCKSSAKTFNGHKSQLAVDTDSQLITAVAVIPGNAPDSAQALEVVEATEANTGCPVEETIGDCAYGDGDTRQEFHEAQRTLVAKVPTQTNQGCFQKTDFTLDLDTLTCTCPAGHTTETFRPAKDGGGVFRFADAVCGPCPLRDKCARGKAGRSVSVHPQERLLQAARAFQANPAFREYRTRRQAVEHRIARLIQLGLRPARSVGRAKTLFQVAMAAAVANLTLLMHRADADPSSGLLTPVPLSIVGLLIALQSRRDGFRRLSPVFASMRRPGGAPRLPLPLRLLGPSPTWPSRPHF
ncbi:MAG: transposase, partial [Chloroflexota bacterium]